MVVFDDVFFFFFWFQYLEEDPRTNRIDDSLQLFTAICSNKLLKKTHLVLLLNKVSFSFFSFFFWEPFYWDEITSFLGTDHPIPSWSLSLIWEGGDGGVISVSYGIRNTGWLCFWNWNWNFDLNVLTLIWPLIWFLFLSFFRQICWDRNSMQGLRSGNSTYFLFFLC